MIQYLYHKSTVLVDTDIASLLRLSRTATARIARNRPCSIVQVYNKNKRTTTCKPQTTSSQQPSGCISGKEYRIYSIDNDSDLWLRYIQYFIHRQA